MRDAILTKAAGHVRTGEYVRVSFGKRREFVGPVFAECNPDVPGNVLLNYPRGTYELAGDDMVETLERIRLPRLVLELDVIAQVSAVPAALKTAGWPYAAVVDICFYLRAGDAAHRTSALEDVFELVGA